MAAKTTRSTLKQAGSKDRASSKRPSGSSKTAVTSKPSSTKPRRTRKLSKRATKKLIDGDALVRLLENSTLHSRLIRSNQLRLSRLESPLKQLVNLEIGR